jgi:hypothetical protein
MYSTYLIARRYTRDVVSCMGWAAIAMIMPNASYLLQSTYIDVQVALFVLAGTYYATRPEYRLVDAWLAAICVTLAIGSKYLALPPAGIVLLIALARLLRHHGSRLRGLATLLGGGALILAMSWQVFWRNWKHFGNPLWPDFDYENAAHKIHFPSVSYGGANPLDMNMGLKELVDALLSVPYSVAGLGHKNQVYDYGIAVIWVVFPLSALTLVVVLFLCARDALGKLTGFRAWLAPEAYNPLLVALPVVAQVWMSPALWSGRYHIGNVGALAALCAFLGGRRGGGRRWFALGEGAAVAGAVMSVVVFFWTKPRWVLLPSELVKLAAIPYPEREVTNAFLLSPTLDVHAGSFILRDVGLDRETLKAGDIVVMTDTGQFPAPLWNNAQTTKLVYVERGPDFFERVNALGARWVYCRSGDAMCAPFAAATGGATPTWKDVGAINGEGWGHVYRRLTP